MNIWLYCQCVFLTNMLGDAFEPWVFLELGRFCRISALPSPRVATNELWLFGKAKDIKFLFDFRNSVLFSSVTLYINIEHMKLGSELNSNSILSFLLLCRSAMMENSPVLLKCGGQSRELLLPFPPTQCSLPAPVHYCSQGHVQWIAAAIFCSKLYWWRRK